MIPLGWAMQLSSSMLREALHPLRKRPFAKIEKHAKVRIRIGSIPTLA